MGTTTTARGLAARRRRAALGATALVAVCASLLWAGTAGAQAYGEPRYSEPRNVEPRYAEPAYGESPYREPAQDADDGCWDIRDRSHIYLGIRGVGLLFASDTNDFDDEYWDAAAGIGFFAGIQVGPLAALEFSWNTSWNSNGFVDLRDRVGLGPGSGDLRLMTLTGDLKLRLPTRHSVVPFLLAGGGYALMAADWPGIGNVRVAEGPTFEVGVGLDFWVSPWLTFQAQAYYRGLYLTPGTRGQGFDPDDYVYKGGAQFDLGMAFRF